MANTAPQTAYRNEFLLGFEQMATVTRDTVTTEAVIKGNTAVFLVADSGGASAVTRGVNGLIPARADNNTQNSCTLAEKHDLVRKTGFNIFESQGDQNRIMQLTSMGVINRSIDDDIIAALAAATNTTGTATTGSLSLIVKAKTILANNQVPMGNNIFALISPALEGYLMQVKEFANAQYVNNKPFEKTQNDGTNYDAYTRFYWYGVNFVVHPRLTGVGTNNETCFMYHRAAIGHAVNKDGLEALIGYFEEQQYSWARTSVFMGSKLLQSKGVCIVPHDGSQLVTS